MPEVVQVQMAVAAKIVAVAVAVAVAAAVVVAVVVAEDTPGQIVVADLVKIVIAQQRPDFGQCTDDGEVAVRTQALAQCRVQHQMWGSGYRSERDLLWGQSPPHTWGWTSSEHPHGS